MTTLTIVLWFSLIGILLALYLTLFTWYCWPALVRKLHCAWCWKAWHLMQWYPRRWSSTICKCHERQLRTQSVARHAHHLAAITPPGEVQAGAYI
jgi:hypothetical protein